MTRKAKRRKRIMTAPARAFDTYDGDTGRQDQPKVLTVIFFFAALVFHGLGNPLNAWELVALGTVTFGVRAWSLFLKRGSFSLNGADLRERYDEVKRSVVLERRDATAGYEITP